MFKFVLLTLIHVNANPNEDFAETFFLYRYSGKEFLSGSC